MTNSSNAKPTPLETWHHVIQSRDVSALDTLLADNVTFHSPVVHSPQSGKAITKIYLTAAMHVLGGPGFHYVRQVSTPTDSVLEFVNVIDGITLNGVDMITWNAQGQIIDFKVMVRPLKAMNMLHQKMGEMLQKIATGQ